MSLHINSNVAALNSHRNLLKNDGQLGRTLEKLSSGLKINRASEGPAALVISEHLRGQIVGMKQAIDNSETAISMIQTTESNLGEVNNLLVSMRQLAIHAANEGVNDKFMLQADQQEYDNAVASISRIGKNAQFGNRQLLDGSQGASGSVNGENLQFIKAGINTADSRENGVAIRITQDASQTQFKGAEALTAEILQTGEKLTVIENGKVATYTTNADDTLDTALGNLMAEVKRNGLDLEVTLDEGGYLNIVSDEFGTGHGFQVSSSSAGVLSQQGGEIESIENGKDIKGTIGGLSTTGKGQHLSGGASSAIDGLEILYTGQAGDGDEIDKVGIEVGKVYVTQNSVQFQIGGNQNQTQGLSISSVMAEKMGNNVKNQSGFTSLADVDLTSFQGASDSLALIDKAINEVTTQRGAIGAFQKNSLESNLSNLRVATENLISSESVIRDVDMASEMADFTRNQIMTQSSTAMLAQANQSPRNVLQLLA